MTALGEFFPKRINSWFANAQYAADIGTDGFGKIKIPAPVATDPDGILAAQAIVTAQDITTFAAAYSDTVMGKFGRNLVVDGSAASTAVITVYGFDYLGQPMVEDITMNGTTTAAGIKAFRYVTRVVTGTDADATLDLGWGDVLGLPYKLLDVYTETVSGAEPADAGTFVKGSTATQSATSADPRGTYAPHSNNIPNGTRYYEIYGIWDITNLYGVQHYYP